MIIEREFDVSIKKISIKNFKNIEEGELSLKTGNRPGAAELLGIFGQNGTGKTGVIESLEILKSLMMSLRIKRDFAEKIYKDKENAEFVFELELQSKESGDLSYSVFYGFKLSQAQEEIFTEKNDIQTISVPNIIDEYLKIPRTGKTALTITISRDPNRLLSATPKKYFPKLLKKTEGPRTAPLIIEREKTYDKSMSYLFSSKFLTFLNEFEEEDSKLVFLIIKVLQSYAIQNLFVVTTRESALNTLGLLPVPFNLHHKKELNYGMFSFDLGEYQKVPGTALPILRKLVSQLNLVLTQLIPGMELRLEEKGTDVNEKGEEVRAVYLSSLRGGKKFPLKYESEGIRKIISILQLLILVYNRKGITVAIDEIDSGIFEYLLGELLFLIQDGGKGQLIFTCHNLRPLEMLSHKSIVFSSTDPNHRFVHYNGVQKTNNLRDLFYREIMVGLQDKPLYQRTNNSDISIALKLAGRIDYEDSTT